MRRTLLLALILVFVASVSFAAFAPQTLKFTAPSQIHYDFDGSTLSVNFYQDGTPATVLFSVFTKDQGNSIVDITNGYYGWHYVNKIDTCIYVAGAQNFGTGANTINWDGTDEAGNLAAAGTYTYYIWGFDNVSAKQSVSYSVPCPWFPNTKFITKGEDGINLTNPLMIGSSENGTYGKETLDLCRFYKWTIGDDPADTGLTQSTFIPLYNYGMQFAVNPADFNILYPQTYTWSISGTMYIQKYTWVPNAQATVDNMWGEDGYFNMTIGSGNDASVGGCNNYNDTDMITFYGCAGHTCLVSKILYIDMETGLQTREMDMSSTYTWYNDHRSVYQNRTPTNGSLVNGRYFMDQAYATPLTCVNLDATTEEDFWLWKNLPGDGHHDFYDDYANWNGVSQYSYRGEMDANWHAVTAAYDVGSSSFDLTLPDGTGAGYYGYAGEVSGYKAGVAVVDYDSAFDGLYMNQAAASANQSYDTWGYIAQDSVTGIITSEVGVEETAPAAYTVAQNTPNPFNPTTTISFNLAKAGKTTVDIYNVAGQKVDTLVNGSMSAGNHSVVWNAAKFSAGVYFYTVKSGSFSKTMKMTLVK